MQINLISYSQPPPDSYNSHWDLKDLVAFCARVSNPSNQYNTETSDKLINYLLKHKHFSPFEMVNVCLEINTTRDISRQIIRHRSFAFQEFSQRYADPTIDNFGYQAREARLQDSKNRQNSIITEDKELHDEWQLKQFEVYAAAKKAYEWAVSKGIAKEQARVVLPEGNTTTRMYMNGSLRSWIHYCEVRTDESTQKEHRLIARKCAEVISQICSTPAIQGFYLKDQ